MRPLNEVAKWYIEQIDNDVVLNVLERALARNIPEGFQPELGSGSRKDKLIQEITRHEVGEKAITASLSQAKDEMLEFYDRQILHSNRLFLSMTALFLCSFVVSAVLEMNSFIVSGRNAFLSILFILLLMAILGTIQYFRLQRRIENTETEIRRLLTLQAQIALTTGLTDPESRNLVYVELIKRLRSKEQNIQINVQNQYGDIIME